MPIEPLVVVTVASLLVTSFASVFVAELAGDKTLYSVSALVTRYHWPVVLLGLAPAFGLKMLAAVSLGSIIGRLPPRLVTVLSVATFVLAAVMLWRGGERTPQREVRAARGGAWAAFAMIFFTEWGDPGQLAAAALVAQYGQPVAVWVGGCSAMLAKGAVALTFGIWVRRFVKPRVMHAAALVVCVVLAITTTIEHWR